MVTVAIAAVLASIALPNLRTYILNARRDSLIDGLVASLNYARTKALDLDQDTYLCPGISTPTSTTCPGGSWSDGWELIDTPVGDSVATQLATHSVSSTGTTPAVTAANGSTSIEFSGDGTVAMQSSSSTNSVELFVVCDARGAASARAVEINTAGYIQSSSTDGQAPDGTALTCS